jgi:hypothetical protein
MRARLSVLAVLAISAASALVIFSSGGETEARAGKQRDFIIAGSDGYGTQDCLSSGSSCGRIVADAWCEAKGFKAALAYRKLAADEITGSTSSGNGAKPAESFLISCRE